MNNTFFPFAHISIPSIINFGLQNVELQSNIMLELLNKFFKKKIKLKIKRNNRAKIINQETIVEKNPKNDQILNKVVDIFDGEIIRQEKLCLKEICPRY